MSVTRCLAFRRCEKAEEEQNVFVFEIEGWAVSVNLNDQNNPIVVHRHSVIVAFVSNSPAKTWSETQHSPLRDPRSSERLRPC